MAQEEMYRKGEGRFESTEKEVGDGVNKAVLFVSYLGHADKDKTYRF